MPRPAMSWYVDGKGTFVHSNPRFPLALGHLRQTKSCGWDAFVGSNRIDADTVDIHSPFGGIQIACALLDNVQVCILCHVRSDG